MRVYIYSALALLVACGPEKIESKPQNISHPTAQGKASVYDVPFSALKIKHMPPVPPYPEEAKPKLVQGSVTIEVIIDSSGEVISANALDGPIELRRASQEMVRKFVFYPAIINNEPSSVRFKLILPWKIH